MMIGILSRLGSADGLQIFIQKKTYYILLYFRHCYIVWNKLWAFELCWTTTQLSLEFPWNDTQYYTRLNSWVKTTLLPISNVKCEIQTIHVPCTSSKNWIKTSRNFQVLLDFNILNINLQFIAFLTNSSLEISPSPSWSTASMTS